MLLKSRSIPLDRALRPYAGQKIQIQIYTMVKSLTTLRRSISSPKHAGLDPEDMRV